MHGETIIKRFTIIAVTLSLIAAFAGCKQIVPAAAPEVQTASAVNTVSTANAQMQAVVETDRIYDGISINGVQIGGLTKEEARVKVSEELLSPLENQKIIVKNEDKTWPLELERLGYKFDIARAVLEAYNIARTGTTEERYEKINQLAAAPRNIEIVPSYNKGVIDTFLEEIAREVETPVVEPAAVFENNGFTITPGSEGAKADTARTKTAVLELADAMTGGEVMLVMESLSPKFTDEDLLKASSLIGTFSTPITGSASRDVNLTVASGYINGVTLYPGEVFSTNETIGPTTYERGYRNAPVIENGKLVDGMGGGVCQVSSTLYNAVLFAELEVTQRKNHSLVVGYIPIGRDATLAGDIIDFQFKNNTEYPIYIESHLEGKRLYVSIYGHETRPEGRKIDFESVWISSTAAPPENEKPDPTLPLGERVVDKASHGGQVIDVYKKIFIDGVMTERVIVDRSTYRAGAGEARVGTGENVTPPPEVPAQEAPAGTGPEAPVNDQVPEWIDTAPQTQSEPADLTNNQEPWWPVDFN